MTAVGQASAAERVGQLKAVEWTVAGASSHRRRHGTGQQTSALTTLHDQGGRVLCQVKAASVSEHRDGVEEEIGTGRYRAVPKLVKR